MNLEMQRELYERYPRFLRRLSGYGGRPYPIDVYGIECGDGWHVILSNLFAQFEKHIEGLRAAGVSKSRWPRAVQVKEKFAVLCVYSKGAIPQELIDAIDTAEAESRTTCEQCGAPGEARGGECFRVTCAACESKPPMAISDNDYAAYSKQLKKILASRSLGNVSDEESRPSNAAGKKRPG